MPSEYLGRKDTRTFASPPATTLREQVGGRTAWAAVVEQDSTFCRRQQEKPRTGSPGPAAALGTHGLPCICERHYPIHARGGWCPWPHQHPEVYSTSPVYYLPPSPPPTLCSPPASLCFSLSPSFSPFHLLKRLYSTSLSP